jgi:hypothetical protein
VPYRPLALVAGLTIGDYALWKWSLNANHDVLALVSGLTLPPLAVALLWLLALSLMRLLGRSTRRKSRPTLARASRGVRERGASRCEPLAREATTTAAAAELERSLAAGSPASSAPSPGELAA